MLMAMKSSTGAAADVVAAVSGKAIRVWSIRWSMDGTGIITIHDGTASATTDLVYAEAVAGSQGGIDFMAVGGQKLTTGNALKVTTSAQTAKVVVYYTIDPS